MQHSAKWNTTNQILKPNNIKLRDINGLASSQIKKMWDRCRSQVRREVLLSAGEHFRAILEYYDPVVHVYGS